MDASSTTYNLIKSSPLLVSTKKDGEDKFWQCLIVNLGDQYYTQTVSYNTTKSGSPSKKVYSTPYLASPKNVGRANATSSEAQAYSEYSSIILKQMDKGYHVPGSQVNIKPLPMLAQKYSDRKKYITFPAFVQPKLDGNRMLFDGKEAWSRGGKPMAHFELMKQFQGVDTDGCILDGELILPGNKLLQETNKARKHSPTELTYQVYDIVKVSQPYRARYSKLVQLVNKIANSHINIVETQEVGSYQDIKNWHKEFVKKGYEGTIIRNRDGGYTINQRSNDLQKYKNFLDEEFLVLDITDGEGSDEGCAIFICKSNVNDNTFNAKLEGTKDHSRSVFKNRKLHVGKQLTVRYQALTKDGLPQFPVAVSIRNPGE